MGIAKYQKTWHTQQFIRQVLWLERGTGEVSDPGKWADVLFCRYLLYTYHLPDVELCTGGYGNEFLELWSQEDLRWNLHQGNLLE